MGQHDATGVVVVMIRRVSKDDARRILGVSDSTIDRRIQRGELSTERDGRRVWVVLDDEVLGASADASPETTPEAARRVNGASADAAEMLQVRLLEERVRSQDELIAMYKTQNSDWEQRYYGLREELAAAHRIAENLSRTLPAGMPTQGRRRWMFWKWDL